MSIADQAESGAGIRSWQGHGLSLAHVSAARRGASQLSFRPLSRRHLQVALGMLWLLDGGLQLQPFMFSQGFVTGVLQPAAAGQPHAIAVSILGVARLMTRHLTFYNTCAATIQIIVGLGILFPRTVKAALLMSFGWALAVWAIGEGFGVLFTGQANPLTGAPGAVLLYLLVGLMVWPADRPPAGSVASQGLLDDYGGRLAWTVLWIGFAALSVQPGSLATDATSAALRAGASIAPTPLARIDGTLSRVSAGHGFGVAIAIAAVEVAIGTAMLHDSWRNAAAMTGAVFAVAIWITAEGLGGLATGQATDPNSGPLLVLAAAALYVPAAVSNRRSVPRPPSRRAAEQTRRIESTQI